MTTTNLNYTLNVKEDIFIPRVMSGFAEVELSLLLSPSADCKKKKRNTHTHIHVSEIP